jgi:hypothetical protein
MNILELFAHIGLKADTGPAEAFNKSIGGMKTALVGAIAGTLSLSAAVKAVNDQFNQSLTMQKFADDTGQSVEEMQKWKAVAQQVSGAGATVAESIRAISSNQAKIRLGQGNISGYQLLGIDSRSDPFKVLEAIRTKTQGLSQSMRRNIAGQFGISNDLVKTLELTNEQFNEMAKNAFVIPQSNIDAMNKARGSLETVKNAVNFLTAKFVTALAPSIDTISKKIAEFVRNYGAKLAEWIQKTVTMIIRIADLINKTIQNTVGWKNAILALVGVFILLNASVMLPVAALVLFMAILEDIYLYSQGKDSLIGRFLEGFPALKKIFDGLLGSVQLLAEAIKSIFIGDFTKLDEMTKKWGLFGDIVSALAHSLGFVKDTLSLENVGGAFGNLGGDVKTKGIGGAMAEQWDLFKGELTDIKNNIGSWFAVRSAPAAAPVTITSSPTVYVSGAANPEATGKAVGEAITRENQRAYNQYAGEKKEK